jgi:3-phosphoshikimate 1-carboxyvinyltransferase
LLPFEHERTLKTQAPKTTHSQVQLKGSVSSQYLTALLMAAPLSKGTEGIEIIITDELVGVSWLVWVKPSAQVSER